MNRNHHSDTLSLEHVGAAIHAAQASTSMRSGAAAAGRAAVICAIIKSATPARRRRPTHVGGNTALIALERRTMSLASDVRQRSLWRRPKSVSLTISCAKTAPVAPPAAAYPLVPTKLGADFLLSAVEDDTIKYCVPIHDPSHCIHTILSPPPSAVCLYSFFYNLKSFSPSPVTSFGFAYYVSILSILYAFLLR